MRVQTPFLERLRETEIDASEVELARICARLGRAGVFLLKRVAVERYAGSSCGARNLCGFYRDFLAQPRLPGGVGVCNVLLVWKDLPEDSVLRPGFFLPLQWHRGQNAEGVPGRLVELAGQVSREINPKDQWEIRFAESMSGWDLSDLEVEAGSARVTLSVSLMAAQRGTATRGDAAVSACWDPENHRFMGVEGLEAKLGAAAAAGCEHVFLSAGDVERATSSAPPGIELKPLVSTGADFGRSVSELLHFMQVPPGPEAPMDRRCGYANNFPRNMRAEREGYILNNITRGRSEAVRRALSNPAACESLVVIASSPSAALLSLLSIRPDRCRVVTTESMEKENAIGQVIKERAEEWIPGTDLNVTTIEDPRDDAGLRRSIGSAAGDSVWVDVTGGTKGMSVRAALCAREVGATVFHIESEGPGSHKAGTEEIVFLSDRPGTERIR